MIKGFMKFFLFTFFLYNFAAHSAVASVSEIKLCYEDVTVYPWITGDKQGLAIDELKLVEKNLKIKIKYIRLPWKRCQSQAKAGLIDGLIAASFNKERTEWGTYPMDHNDKLDREYRLHTDSFHVYVRKDSKISWKNSSFHNVGTSPVGVQLGYSVGDDVQKAGYHTNSSFKTAYDLLKGLDRGMIRLAVLQNHAVLKTLMENPELGKNIERQDEPFKVADQYVLFNTVFFNKNRELCIKLWRGVSVARNSQEYQKHEQAFFKNLPAIKTDTANF